MAGDRGLAFVVIGLIGLSTLWIASARRDDRPKPQTAAAGISVPAASVSAFPRSIDARFLARAVQQSLVETLLSDLAEQKGGSAVRQLAVRLSSEYRGINSELRRLASLQGLEISSEIDLESRAIYNNLAALAGDAFDRHYASRALSIHRAAESNFQQEAANGAYPELKRFAADRLPAVKQRSVLLENTAAQAGVVFPIE